MLFKTPFKTRFKHTRIRTKFNLLLLLVVTVAIVLSSITLRIALQARVESELGARASLLMDTMNSVRIYTQNNVHPLLEQRLKTETTFTKEAIPTSAVKNIFVQLRQLPGYQHFTYKDATLNPTNLEDLADAWEAQLVRQFRQQPALQQTSGFRQMPQARSFYIAKPFKVTQQSCLQCHSTPDRAPKSLLTTYGYRGGFGWQLNEIVAAQIVYVPAQDVADQAHHLFVKFLGILVGVLGIVTLLSNFLLKRTVIERIRRIAKVAQSVSQGDMTAKFAEDSQDEIGLLVVAFDRMRLSLEIAIKMISQQKPL